MHKKNAVVLIRVCMLMVLAISINTRIPFAWNDISDNSDDGTEVNESYWYENGFQPSLNCLGRYFNEETYDVGLRFHVENLNQGENITYARLRFASWGSEITSTVQLLIEGVLQESPTTFSQDERPSQKTPKTNTKINWEINESWLEGSDAVPLYYSSPNIAPIINEILALPNWGTGPEGKTLIITIKDNGSNPSEINRVFFEDFWIEVDDFSTPAILEIYKTVYDTFLGKEFLGRVTDTSVTVNLYSLIETDTYIEYGTTPGVYTHTTPQYLNQPAEQPIEIILDNLLPDTQRYYRLFYRKAGEGDYEHGEEHTFCTQRPRGSSFVFAINADEHLQKMYKLPQNVENMQLYRQTLQNIAESDPDFLFSLGDFAHPEFYVGRNVANLQEATERYLLQREYLDDIAHSIPFYLVIGNHEGEEGWYYDFEIPGQNDDSLAVIATKARKKIIPNPYPDIFYTGNPDVVPEYGLREDYFAWEWGDALFVALDPFWYTERKPHHKGPEPCTGDGWDWTLGKQQYDWLYETLHNSGARWKFIFIHHLTSSIDHPFWRFYGRGGIEVAKYKVDGRASYEWGGEDETGAYVFDVKRPDWIYGPIHDMLVAENVNIVFHGHDHFFAKQDLDGIVYQECPQPGDSNYNYGLKIEGGYKYGDFFPNSGHLQVTVNPYFVDVEYVRSYLPGDGENGTIAYSYIISILSGNPDTLDFGSVVVGTDSVDTFYVSNRGADTLQVVDLTCVSSVFEVEDNTPFPVAPSETKPVAVSFAPDAVQMEEATVSVITNAGEDSVKLLGQGAPLAAIQNLRATVSKTDLHLQWENIEGATHYRIYRDTIAIFLPSPDDTLATTTELQYLDSAAVGNPAINYFYVVIAVNDLTESALSNGVGEFDGNLITGSPVSRAQSLSSTGR